MTIFEYSETAWREAVDWIAREHQAPLDDVAYRDLLSWLAADTSHRQAYDEARKVWLATGLVPAAHE